MAIAPIDLQTLFTQVDKVARTQMSEREGLALAQSIQGVQIQKKTEEKINQVNEAQDTGDGVEKVKDKERGHEGKSGSKKNNNNEQDDENPRSPVLRDPNIGKKIDISL